MRRLFIIGAAKCGTTSLYNYLKQHPELYFSPVKEPNFFSEVYPLTNSEKIKPKKGKEYHSKVINDWEIYDGLFKDAIKEKHKYLCECSTSYLFDKNSAKLIKKSYPDAKIIVMLRNPVSRAYSHFKMYQNSGVEKSIDFLQALIKDYENDEKVLGKYFGYIEIGLYHKQLTRYFNEFDPSQIKIITFESFICNIPGYMEEIADFLGVNPSSMNEIDYNVIHNEGFKPKNGLIKNLFRLKNKFYFISELLPERIKKILKNKFFMKDSDKQISPEAVSYIQNKIYQDTVLLKNYMPELEVDQLINSRK